MGLHNTYGMISVSAEEVESMVWFLSELSVDSNLTTLDPFGTKHEGFPQVKIPNDDSPTLKISVPAIFHDTEIIGSGS